MAFQITPCFLVVFWSPLLLCNYKLAWRLYEQSNHVSGGSLVCVILLCRFLNLPITSLSVHFFLLKLDFLAE